MLRSMTAFCQTENASQKAKYKIEIQSLNRRHLELILQLPKELLSLEAKIRTKISEKIFRGRVTLTLNMVAFETHPVVMEPNLPYCDQLRKAAAKLCEATDLKPTDGELFRWIATQQGAFTQVSEPIPDDLEKELFRCLEDALDDLVDQKEKEGKSLNAEIFGRIEAIEAAFAKLQPLVPDAEINLKTRLETKWKNLSEGTEPDERILKEIALLVEKADVSEELVRFSLHLNQFRSFLEETDFVSGKKLDFLCQELLREVHTLNVKAQTAEISKLAIEIKSDLEKIREQIQNIE